METTPSNFLIPLHSLPPSFLVNESYIYHNMRFSKLLSQTNFLDPSLRGAYLVDVVLWVLTKEDVHDECLQCLKHINTAFQILWMEDKECWFSDISTLFFWASTGILNISDQALEFESQLSWIKTGSILISLLRYLSFHWNTKQCEDIIPFIKSIMKRKGNSLPLIPCLPHFSSIASPNLAFDSNVIAECILSKFDSILGCPFSLSDPNTTLHSSSNSQSLPTFNLHLLLSFHLSPSKPMPLSLNFLSSLIHDIVPMPFIISRLRFWLRTCTFPIHLLSLASFLSLHLKDSLKSLFFEFLEELKLDSTLQRSHILFIAFVRNCFPSYSTFVEEVINLDKWAFLSNSSQTTIFFTWLKDIIPYEPRQVLDLNLKLINVPTMAQPIYISIYQYFVKEKMGEVVNVSDDVIKEAKLIYSSLQRTHPTAMSTSKSLSVAIPTRVHNLLLIKRKWFLESVLPYLFRYGQAEVMHGFMSALWNIRKIPSELWQEWMLYQSKQSSALEDEKNLEILHKNAIQAIAASPKDPLPISWKGYMCLALVNTWRHCELFQRGTFIPELHTLEPISRSTHILWTVLQQLRVQSIDEGTVLKIVSNLVRGQSLCIPLFTPRPTPLMKESLSVFRYPWDCLIWPWLVEPIAAQSITHLDVFIKNLIISWTQSNLSFHVHYHLETASTLSFHFLFYAKLLFWLNHASDTCPFPPNHPVFHVLGERSLPSDLCVYWGSNERVLTLHYPIETFLDNVLVFRLLQPRYVSGLDFSDLELTLKKWVPFRLQFGLLLDWLETLFQNEPPRSSLSGDFIHKLSLQVHQIHGDALGEKVISVLSPFSDSLN